MVSTSFFFSKTSELRENDQVSKIYQRKMTDIKQQLHALLSGGANSLLTSIESTQQERTIPTEDGPRIIIQQRREVEQEKA